MEPNRKFRICSPWKPKHLGCRHPRRSAHLLGEHRDSGRFAATPTASGSSAQLFSFRLGIQSVLGRDARSLCRSDTENTLNVDRYSKNKTNQTHPNQDGYFVECPRAFTGCPLCRIRSAFFCVLTCATVVANCGTLLQTFGISFARQVDF